MGHFVSEYTNISACLLEMTLATLKIPELCSKVIFWVTLLSTVVIDEEDPPCVKMCVSII